MRVLPTAQCAQGKIASVRCHTLRAHGRGQQIVASPPALPAERVFAAGLLHWTSDDRAVVQRVLVDRIDEIAPAIGRTR